VAEEYARTRSTENRTGIQGYIRIPDNWTVPASGDYINFYVGLDNFAEGGISWGFANNAWHYFLNCGRGNFNESVRFADQPTPGELVHLKLVNDGNGYVSFYLNGVLIWGGGGDIPHPRNPALPESSKVKHVCAAFDQGGAWAVEHSSAIWSTLKTRLDSGAWEDWSDAGSYTHEHTSRYKVTTELPLNAELEA